VAADPTNWWGIPEWTDNDHPVRDPAEPLRFSGSAWTGIDSCSLSWFLDREVKGAVTRGSAPAFGSVVHALADAVARGELAADTDVLVGRAEQVWAGLGFEADWQAQEELVAIRQALDLFLRWHEAQPDRKVVATELKFAANLEIADDAVAVNGSIDRLERDSDGMLHIVDLKTGRKPPTGPEVAEHLQLSLYQLAGEEHAFDDRTDNNGVAGAELVQLRSPVARTGLPKVQVQPPIDVEAVKERLAEAVEIVRSERFTPDPVSGMCRNCQFLLVCPAQSLGEQVTT
ncbi:MAG: PD-(D/E)XK nuclease family protein, partial [Candidatus Nanopelagicales bacterium]